MAGGIFPTHSQASHWDLRFLGLAKHIAGWSRDPSTKVGSVIVDKEHRIVSTGFNGIPRGLEDSPDRLEHRETKLRLTLHAEHNACLFAQRSLSGCTCYVWPMPPCTQCAAVLIQCGIKRVVAPQATEEMESRWGADIALTKEIFDEAGVEWLFVNLAAVL